MKGSLVTLVAQFSGEGMGCKWRRWDVERRKTGQLNQERSCKSVASAEVSEGDFDRQRRACRAAWGGCLGEATAWQEIRRFL